MSPPTATAREIRAPWIIRLSTSRPIISAPNRYVPPGGASEAFGLVVNGSSGATVLAKIAVNTNTIMMTAPPTPNG